MVRSPAVTARRWPYLFLAPFMAVFGTFHLYPLARSLALSFCATPAPHRTTFVGLANYAYLARDLDVLGWPWPTPAAYVVAFLAVQVHAVVGARDRAGRPPRGSAANGLRFAFFSTSLVGSVFVAVVVRPPAGPPRGPTRPVVDDRRGSPTRSWPGRPCCWPGCG